MTKRERAAIYGRQSQGKTKSIEDQLEIGLQEVDNQGWALFGTFSDKVSASRFSTKPRGGWNDVVFAVQRGDFDILVLWESSRGDRTPETWLAFLGNCRDVGVKIHVISHERTYDPRISRDMKTLREEGINSAYESDVLSDRILRGVRLAAAAGRPAAGPTPYGYRRVYDPASGLLVGQEPDPETAPIVTEIIARVARSEPLARITADLNDRGIVPPGAASANGQTSRKWYRERVRKIASSRTYLGERKHKGEWHPAGWPALTDPETFAAAGRVLNDPRRLTTKPEIRPGHQKHLLTYLATCAKCGGPARARGNAYVCKAGCFHIKRDRVDELIRDLAVARLSSPDLYAELEQAADAADATLKAARAEVTALAADLEEYRALARARKISPASFAELEAGLLADIDAAQARIDSATVPADLEGWVGPEADVRARWENAPVQARRTVLRAIRLKVTFHASGQNSYAFLTDRVAVDWV